MFSDGLAKGGGLGAGVDPSHHGSSGRRDSRQFTGDVAKVSKRDFIHNGTGKISLFRFFQK